jgi:hypothetical protein
MSLYELFHVLPLGGVAKFPQAAEGKEAELGLNYVHDFWESGNHVVGLTFAASFGFYLIIAQNPQLRTLAFNRRSELAFLAVFGNAALAFLLFRLVVHEYRLVSALTANATALDAVWSAFEMRMTLLVVNLAIYLWIVLLVVKSSSLDQLESTQAGMAVLAHDDVVVDGDAERLCGVDDRSRHVDIGA